MKCTYLSKHPDQLQNTKSILLIPNNLFNLDIAMQLYICVVRIASHLHMEEERENGEGGGVTVCRE